MELERYITIKAIKTKDNELIPIWDERIIFIENENYGNAVLLKGEFSKGYFTVVECIYDLLAKKISSKSNKNKENETNTIN